MRDYEYLIGMAGTGAALGAAVAGLAYGPTIGLVTCVLLLAFCGILVVGLTTTR